MEQKECKLKTFLESNNVLLDEIDFKDGIYPFGTVLYAKRYENGQEKKLLPIGHRNGYYLVVKSNKDGIFCLYGTSNVPNKNELYSYFKIDGTKYGFDNDIYFSFFKNRLMKDYSIISNEGIISDDNKKELVQKMKECLLVEDNFTCGDVVRYLDMQYLIVSVDEAKYLTMGLKSSGKICVFIDGVQYFTDIGCLKNLKKNSLLVKTGSIELEDLKALKVKLDKHIEQVKYNKTCHVGSLIRKKDAYYIYGETEESWLTFKVLPKGNDKDNNNIVINGKKFKGMFDEVEVLSKSDTDYKIKYSATPEEILFIESLRLSLEKHEEPEEVQDIFNDDSSEKVNLGILGWLVQDIETKKEYIVISKEAGELLLLDKEKYLEGKFFVKVLSNKLVKRTNVLSKKAFLEILNSLKDTYSSYMTRSYIPSLIKLYNE